MYPLTMYILIIFLFLYNSFHCCLFFLCKGLFFYSMVAHFSVIIYTVRKEVLKYKKLASRTSHTNAWLRQIADADPEKSLYKNHITTETTIDGKCIRLSTIEKYCGYMVMECFREAFKKKEKYSSYRFDFCGYDGTLWCEPREDGDMVAGFMKEYRNTRNGHYYLLINDNTMIGYDID